MIIVLKHRKNQIILKLLINHVSIEYYCTYVKNVIIIYLSQLRFIYGVVDVEASFVLNMYFH